jgi:sarcosine oxidase
MVKPQADVIVIGLGAVGSATTYQLAKLGIKVVGIDRFSPPHDLGASAGATRITRQAIGESGPYVPLVLRSHEIWREIEAETDADLLTITGGLIMQPASSKAGQHGIESPWFLWRLRGVQLPLRWG